MIRYTFLSKIDELEAKVEAFISLAIREIYNN